MENLLEGNLALAVLDPVLLHRWLLLYRALVVSELPVFAVFEVPNTNDSK